MDTEALIRAYWQAAQERDWEAFGALVAPDVIYREPQTREIVRGREDYVVFNQAYPGDWHLTVERVVAQADSGVSWTSVVVGEETMTGLCFFSVADGLITQVDDFWPEPYEPADRGTTVVSRY